MTDFDCTGCTNDTEKKTLEILGFGLAVFIMIFAVAPLVLICCCVYFCCCRTKTAVIAHSREQYPLIAENGNIQQRPRYERVSDVHRQPATYEDDNGAVRS